MNQRPAFLPTNYLVNLHVFGRDVGMALAVKPSIDGTIPLWVFSTGLEPTVKFVVGEPKSP